LTEKGLLPDKLPTKSIEYYIISTDDNLLDQAIALTAKIRTKDINAEFSYKSGKIGKLLKTASETNAKNCIILGQEFNDRNALTIKNLLTSEQIEIEVSAFLSSL
jgi:histidyl-tRNA synthetase